MELNSRMAFRRLLPGIGIALAAALGIYAAINTGQDGGTLLSIFSTRFLGIFIEAAPFLLLGSLASGLIDSFVSADDIARIIPRQPALAALTGAVMGFAFPVCECGVVPVVRRLYSKGLPLSVGVTFLLAAPVINPIVIAGTYAAFGFGTVLIGRVVITIVVATVIGLIFSVATKPQEILRPSSLADGLPRRMPLPVMGGSGVEMPISTVAASPHPARKSLVVGARDALSMAGDEFFDMGRYLILGSMLAAAMQTVVSQDVLLALGRGPIVSVLTMQLLAFVLSVCSTVDAFLALAFTGTFTTGSILAFLTFGPMVDIKSTLMFAGVYRRKVVVYLIVLPFLMTALIGIWINLNLAL